MADITEVATLIYEVMGGINAVGQPFDLGNLPRKMQEIERKYKFKHNPLGDGGLANFGAKLEKVLQERKATSDPAQPFTGVDEYYIFFASDGTNITVRYRVGGNKLPELTAKFQLGSGNEHRGEINLDVSKSEPESVRAFIAVFARALPKVIQFAVQQCGVRWMVHDPEYGLLEIVWYQVYGIEPEKAAESLAEVESKNRDPEIALTGVKTYEGELGLESSRCDQSIAELFAPPDA